MRSGRYPVICILLLLAACAGPDRRDVASAGWAAHKETVQLLQHWSASGKLALRSSTASESATLNWRQQEQHTHLELRGPLGVGATTIHSDGLQLDIYRGEEHRTVDISSPGAIVENTGWELPLSALPYWLKGIPSPAYPVESLELDPQTQLLSKLQQDSWEIHYGKYEQFQQFILPTRLDIQRNGTSARLIIRQWRVEGP